MNIAGGIVGDRFDAESGSEVNISGGTVGDEVSAKSGALVNITGGTLGNEFFAFSNSEVNISGGTVGDSFGNSGSVLNISGGAFGHSFGGLRSVVNISGGTFGENVRILSDTVFNILGTEFFIDGERLDDLLPGETFTITRQNATVSGIFADGNQFSFDLREDVVREGWGTINLMLDSPNSLGDVNLDGSVNFLDISPFVGVLSTGGFQAEADIDQNGVVNFLDISPFVGILSGN